MSKFEQVEAVMEPLRNHPMWSYVHFNGYKDEADYFWVYGGCQLEISFNLENDDPIIDTYICVNDPPYPKFQGDKDSGDLVHTVTGDIELIRALAKHQLDEMLKMKERKDNGENI